MHTDSIKINRPYHNIRIYWTNIWQPTIDVQQSIFEKIRIKVCSTHLYASFGTFCAYIGQLFETQRVFEVCLRIDKSLWSKEKVVDFGILPNVWRLTVPRPIDQFWRKKCQKKSKDVEYKLIQDLKKLYFMLHERSTVKSLFSTYVCFTLDGLFWLNLYVIL